MRLLFALSVASFCTVLWLALALARRVRRGQDARGEEQCRRQQSRVGSGTEYFEAGEFRTPRALRLIQDIAQHGVRHSREDSTPAERSVPDRPIRVAGNRATLLPVADAAHLRTLHRMLDQTAGAPRSEAVIVNSKLQFLPVEHPHEAVDPKPHIALHNTLPRDLSRERKAPQPARLGTFRRVDLSHYNKDWGDLTDPYTHSPRNSGLGPGAAKSG